MLYIIAGADLRLSATEFKRGMLIYFLQPKDEQDLKTQIEAAVTEDKTSSYAKSDIDEYVTWYYTIHKLHYP